MRNSKHSLLALPAFLILLPVFLSAQIDTVWVHRWTSPGAESDWAYAIAVDDSGHIYVTGKTNNASTNDDWTTIKYDPDGDTVWIRNFASPGTANERANAIAIGLSGNIYLTGYTMSSGAGDYLTIKYRPNGDTAWTKIYDGISAQYDFSKWVAVDEQENVYVTGYSRGLSYQNDIATVKYDSSGTQLWVTRINGSGNYNDQGNKVITDDNGNVYVAGYLNPFSSGTRYDYATIKYRAASGDTAWVRTYNGTADSSDIARDIEVDASGNVYVTGSCRNTGTLNDIVTIKYDSTGNQEWVATYNNPDTSGSDGGYGIKVDGLGNVYVVGQSQGLGTNTDIVTIKYDSDGNEVWTERYNGPESNYDTPSTEDGGKCMAMDMYANIYITGVSRSATSNYDYLAIKYDSAGVEQWVAGYNCCDSVDYALAVAADNAGGVYIAGRSVGLGTYYDMATVCFLEPLDMHPPLAPYIAQAEKSGNDFVLTWNKITTDTLGNPETMDHYVVYRNTSPSFILGASDSIGVTVHPDTTYTDVGILNASQSYYYLVKAVDSVDNRSKKSNMGFVCHKFINENPGATGDRNWVSLPYISEYDSIKDLTGDVSSAGDPISKITMLEVEAPQNYYSWIYHQILGWYGNHPTYPNFPIELGQAYEMVGVTDDTVIFAGANEPDSVVILNENPGTTSDRNWISVPYNAVYDSVSDVTDELSPGGQPVSKITMLDEPTQIYYSWIYHFVLGWYGNHPTTPNFPIEPGDGYEFIATKDTTWNPAEHSNEAAAATMLTSRSHQREDVEFHRGTALQPERAPAWSVAKSREKIDYSKAHAYSPARKDVEKADYCEAGISHIVHVDLELEEFDGLLFTTYRPHRPYDVLTENSAGCVIAKQRGIYRLISFDVGNFKYAWHDDEEVIIIIEAVKNGRGYFTVANFLLDKGVDIQDLRDEISLVPIPAPEVHKGSTRWDRVDNDNIVGYSIYQNDIRLNNKVITTKEYPAVSEVVLKPVIKGGYETIYSSREGTQSTPDAQIPLSYAFAIFPNPFTRTTGINYALPHQTQVDIKIFDVSGRLVKTVVSDNLESGYYQDTWSGGDDMGRRLTAGVYFIHMTTDDYKSHNKVIFIR